MSKKTNALYREKRELRSAYSNAIKQKDVFYVALKKELQHLLDGKNYKYKWKSYKMICENQHFLKFNLEVLAIIIAIVALVSNIEINTISAIIILLLICSVIVVGSILMHKRECKYNYISYILEELKKEDNDK